MTHLRPVRGVRPIVIDSLRREIAPASDLRTLIRLVRLFRDLRPDMVHTHLAKAGLLGRIAARITGVRIVVHTYHGNVLRGYFGGVQSRAFLGLERALARITTRIVSISSRQTREIIDLGIAPLARIVEIPLGIDLAPFLTPAKGRLRAELGVGAADPLVGIVARLVPIKGVDVFLEAAAHVARERPGTLFVVVGDGELAGSLRSQVVALGIEGCVWFLGWRADVSPIYADLDVVVQASHNEGTPVAIIEALAAGRAVVATAVGGVPDLLGDPECGLLVGDGDSEGVSRAILTLLSDEGRRLALGAAGKRRVYPEHDVSTLIARVSAMYTDLASRARS